MNDYDMDHGYMNTTDPVMEQMRHMTVDDMLATMNRVKHEVRVERLKREQPNKPSLHDLGPHWKLVPILDGQAQFMQLDVYQVTNWSEGRNIPNIVRHFDLWWVATLIKHKALTQFYAIRDDLSGVYTYSSLDQSIHRR